MSDLDLDLGLVTGILVTLATGERSGAPVGIYLDPDAVKAFRLYLDESLAALSADHRTPSGKRLHRGECLWCDAFEQVAEA